MHLSLQKYKISDTIFLYPTFDYQPFMEVDDMKNKHFDLSDRIYIETSLDKGISIHKIALHLGKHDSSVAREIQRNRYKYRRRAYEGYQCAGERNCMVIHACNRDDCNKMCHGCIEVCNSEACPSYVPVTCKYIKGAPYCCNGCEKLNSGICHYPKYKYSAQNAQNLYKENLKETRSGTSLSPEEMKFIDELVSPLLLKGQSLSSIYITHKEELPCSLKSLYNYVDNCYLTARNIDLPRKVKYKVRNKHYKDTRNLPNFAVDRTYNDYKQYISEHPDCNVVEMDTVIGSKDGGKVLLTLMFCNCSLMVAILLPDKTQNSVINALNKICEGIGIEEFRRLFGIILTDRGTEFANPYALECYSNGEIKTRVYYCDPYCSWQKPHVEKNHELIRCILPTGKSFENLSQQDITLMMNHINSYPRANLNGNSPFDLAKLLIGPALLKMLHYHKIQPDDVILKPLLLWQPKNK